MQSYRELVVWQRGLDLTESCYALTAAFPQSEMYGLTSQIRRAAASVPANIAEGHGRESTGSFIQFLRIAQGSLKEIETHLIVSERVGLAAGEIVNPVLNQCDEIGRMLRALIRSLQAKQNS